MNVTLKTVGTRRKLRSAPMLYTKIGVLEEQDVIMVFEGTETADLHGTRFVKVLTRLGLGWVHVGYLASL